MYNILKQYLTQMLKISVASFLSDKKSSFIDNKYIFAYSIILENKSTQIIVIKNIKAHMLYEHGFSDNLSLKTNLKPINVNKSESISNILIIRDNTYGVMCIKCSYKLNDEDFIYNETYNHEITVGKSQYAKEDWL